MDSVRKQRGRTRVARAKAAEQGARGRKRQRSARAPRRSGLGTAWDGALDGLVLVDAGLVVRDANPAAAALFGVPREALVGMALAALFDPPLGDAGGTRWRELERVGSARAAAHVRRPDATVAWVELTATANLLPGRHLLALRDATERRRAEQRRAAQFLLTSALAETHALVDAAPAIVRALAEPLGWDGASFFLLDPRAGLLRSVASWRPQAAGAASAPPLEDALTSSWPAPWDLAPTRAAESARPGEPPATRAALAGARSSAALRAPPWSVACAAAFAPPRARREGLSRAAVWLESLAAEPDGTRGALARSLGYDGALLVPVVSERQAYGLVELWARAPRRRDEDHVRKVVELAEQVRQAIDRWSAEESLRASEQRYRTLIERSPEGVFLEVGGELTYANPAFRRMLGESDVLGRNVLDLVHADSRDAFAACVAAAHASTPSPHEVAVRWLHRDGRSTETEVIATLVGPARQGTVQVLVRDVTERRQLEARLQRADRLSALGTLAAGVAHEINNPLTFTISNLVHARRRVLSLARSEALDPASRAELDAMGEGLAEAHEGAERVRRIVRDLRTFSRVDGDLAGPADVAAVLESSLAVAQNELRHRARVERAFEPVPPVHADAHRLAQVFLNLLVNAAQSIPEGHAQANVVRVATRLAPDGRVCVEVSDSGCGIAPEVRERIFEPFFTTKPVGVGTGLGLSTAHGIVTALGGELLVESELGVGSAFRVLLRAATEPAGVPAVVPLEPAVARRARLMVVDDEPLIGRAVERMLGGEHDLVFVNDPREALARLVGGERFDLVLCDVMMPELSGPALHASLAEQAPEMAARVVFMTGGAFTPMTQAYLAERATRTLEKPFEPEALRALVQEFAA